MDEISLTNEADFLLCSLYKEYLEKRKAGIFREDAVVFGTASKIQEEIVNDWPIQDIEDVIRELSRAKMVSCEWSDNTFSRGKLTTDGIVYMETRFGRKIDSVINRISSLTSLLGF